MFAFLYRHEMEATPLKLEVRLCMFPEILKYKRNILLTTGQDLPSYTDMGLPFVDFIEDLQKKKKNYSVNSLGKLK